MFLAQKVVSERLERHFGAVLAQSRLCFARAQVEAVYLACGQRSLLVADISLNILDLAAVAFTVEDDDNTRDVRRGEMRAKSSSLCPTGWSPNSPPGARSPSSAGTVGEAVVRGGSRTAAGMAANPLGAR